MQSSGESYDRARETLKHVSVDASGKVELEDWVEVRTASDDVTIHRNLRLRLAKREIKIGEAEHGPCNESGKGNRAGHECEYQPHDK